MKSGLRELGDACNSFNVPSHDQLNSATLDNPLNWDVIGNFTRNENKSIESYEE